MTTTFPTYPNTSFNGTNCNGTPGYGATGYNGTGIPGYNGTTGPINTPVNAPINTPFSGTVGGPIGGQYGYGLASFGGTPSPFFGAFTPGFFGTSPIGTYGNPWTNNLHGNGFTQGYPIGGFPYGQFTPWTGTTPFGPTGTYANTFSPWTTPFFGAYGAQNSGSFPQNLQNTFGFNTFGQNVFGQNFPGQGTFGPSFQNFVPGISQNWGNPSFGLTPWTTPSWNSTPWSFAGSTGGQWIPGTNGFNPIGSVAPFFGTTPFNYSTDRKSVV